MRHQLSVLLLSALRAKTSRGTFLRCRVSRHLSSLIVAFLHAKRTRCSSSRAVLINRVCNHLSAAAKARAARRLRFSALLQPLLARALHNNKFDQLYENAQQAGIDAATHAVEQQVAASEGVAADVVLQVKTLYYNILLARSVEGVLVESRDAFEDAGLQVVFGHGR